MRVRRNEEVEILPLPAVRDAGRAPHHRVSARRTRRAGHIRARCAIRLRTKAATRGAATPEKAARMKPIAPPIATSRADSSRPALHKTRVVQAQRHCPSLTALRRECANGNNPHSGGK